MISLWINFELVWFWRWCFISSFCLSIAETESQGGHLYLKLDPQFSLNVKRVKKRVNANSLEKEWKPLKNSCYPLEKERNEKKSEIFHSKKSEKRVRVNTSEHHSKMYCPLFNSLKNGHSLAESERHSFSSEYSTILLVLLTIHSKRSEVHSQRVNVHSLKI